MSEKNEFSINGTSNQTVYSNPCFCIGKQNGEPYCPCEMRSKKVYKRNGRWIEPEKDLGEV